MGLAATADGVQQDRLGPGVAANLHLGVQQLCPVSAISPSGFRMASGSGNGVVIWSLGPGTRLTQRGTLPLAGYVPPSVGKQLQRQLVIARRDGKQQRKKSSQKRAAEAAQRGGGNSSGKKSAMQGKKSAMQGKRKRQAAGSSARHAGGAGTRTVAGPQQDMSSSRTFTAASLAPELQPEHRDGRGLEAPRLVGRPVVYRRRQRQGPGQGRGAGGQVDGVDGGSTGASRGRGE